MNVERGGVAVATYGKFNFKAKKKWIQFPTVFPIIYLLGGYLFAVGGNNGTSSLDSCERYDPLLNKWTRIASMRNRR